MRWPRLAMVARASRAHRKANADEANHNHFNMEAPLSKNGQGTSLLAFEAHLLESTLRVSIAHMRETLSPVEADAAVERLLQLEMAIPISPTLRLVAGKYVPLQESADTSVEAEK
jgi:hypothetical protein